MINIISEIATVRIGASFHRVNTFPRFGLTHGKIILYMTTVTKLWKWPHYFIRVSFFNLQAPLSSLDYERLGHSAGKDTTYVSPIESNFSRLNIWSLTIYATISLKICCTKVADLCHVLQVFCPFPLFNQKMGRFDLFAKEMETAGVLWRRN